MAKPMESQSDFGNKLRAALSAPVNHSTFTLRANRITYVSADAFFAEIERRRIALSKQIGGR